ncbi:MAG TPA: glutamate--tRNA ligase [Bacteroidetes bacterium]|nr:glutamate--tRNA ligase [Bacteroidota bacterium]
MTTKVRVRFAPSPTGMLHIGGLRTALFNYLFAKHHNGDFILRIEDTDQNRYVESAEKDITDALKWAGMMYDEGPDVAGNFGPYRQSERSVLYKKYADQLIEQDHAYYAFDTTEEIEQMRERLQKSGNPSPKYDSITRMSMKNSLTLSKDEVQKRLDAGDEYVVRLKVPRRDTIKFTDIIRGVVSFNSAGLDDQVLIKSDGLPTYHLANVVDDHTMEITHVIRGEEWLSSAPKHMLLYEYLGWEPPQMAHLPLIMSPAGGKLSKRNAEELGIPVNVRDYIKGNYEPEALINFLALLGWNPGDDRELFSMEELISEFDLHRVSKAGAVFNLQKLLWFNEHYMRSRSNEDLLVNFKNDIEASGLVVPSDAFLLKVIELMKERVSNATELFTLGKYYFEAPAEFDEKTVSKAWKGDAPALVNEYAASIRETNEYTAANLKAILTQLVESKGLGFGKVMLPVRLAVTGMGFGPDLFETLELLGKEEVDRRLIHAENTLS